MIDFVKILLKNIDFNILLQNPLLEFEGKYNRATGEVSEFPLEEEFHGLKFIIKSAQTIFLQGSLHKYWNSLNTGIKQNYNDFNFTNLVFTIFDLKEKFNIDLFTAIIQNIEFGVNIITPYDPNTFLKLLINHKGDSFNTEKGKNKYYRQCKKQQYIVKVYNKGLQNELKKNILRFEGKILKMKRIEKTGIKTLSDLLDINKFSQLKPILMEIYDDILLFDKSIDYNPLNERERLILNSGSNPTYWEELKEKQKENFYKKRNRFNEILDKCGGNILKNTTRKLIYEKWNELAKTHEETLQKLTDLKKQHITEINHSSIVLIPSSSSKDSIRKCLTCGIDISNKCKNKFTNPKLNPKNNLLHRIKKNDKNYKLFDTDSLLMLSVVQSHLLERPNTIYND